MRAFDLPRAPVRERPVIPVLGVLAVMVAVVLGGYVVAAALSEPAGPPVDVGGAVRIAPLSGWELAGRSDDPPRATLTRGSGTLDVAAAAFATSSDDLLRGYVGEVLEPNAVRLFVSDAEPVVLDSGLRGARVGYVGTFGGVQAPIEGQVSAFVTSAGVGVVFDGWAPSGLLRFVLDDIDRMIGRAVVS